MKLLSKLHTYSSSGFGLTMSLSEQAILFTNIDLLLLIILTNWFTELSLKQSIFMYTSIFLYNDHFAVLLKHNLNNCIPFVYY